MAPAIKASMPRPRSAPITRLRFSGLIIFPSSRLRHATFVRHNQDAKDGCIEGSTCRACPGLALAATLQSPLLRMPSPLPVRLPRLLSGFVYLSESCASLLNELHLLRIIVSCFRRESRLRYGLCFERAACCERT